MILGESIVIAAPPERVYRFFETIEDRYREWHPDHVSFRWEDGDGLSVGSVATFEERIGGSTERRRVRFTVVNQAESIEFEPTSRLERLFLPAVRFSFESVDSGCRFSQHIRVRTGPLGRWLNRRGFEAVRTHMHEEGINLKRIIEQES